MTTAQVAEGLSADLAVQRRIRPTYGYYRKSDGWIAPAVITRLERLRHIEQGWQHLEQYGSFDMSPYVANHTLEGLFMFGGAKELSVDQIIKMGFHLNPPIVPVCRQHMTQFHRAHTPECWRGARPVEFPQLAGVAPERLRPHPCEFCERVSPTPEAKRQHQQVAHKDELNNLQAGRSLATAIALNTTPAGPAAPADQSAEIAMLKQQLAALQANATAPRVPEKKARTPKQIEATKKWSAAGVKAHKKEQVTTSPGQ